MNHAKSHKNKNKDHEYQELLVPGVQLTRLLVDYVEKRKRAGHEYMFYGTRGNQHGPKQIAEPLKNKAVSAKLGLGISALRHAFILHYADQVDRNYDKVKYLCGYMKHSPQIAMEIYGNKRTEYKYVPWPQIEDYVQAALDGRDLPELVAQGDMDLSD